MSSTIKRAKTLDDEQLDTLMTFIDNHTAMPERDRLIFLLSYKGGLRAGEIAKIDMDAMTDAEGRISKAITVSRKIAKKGRERAVPMHPKIKEALRVFRTRHPFTNFVAVSSADRKSQMRPATLAQYMRRLYLNAGFQNCSSHSGRRTFGTKAARQCNMHNRSLRDVQKLMGHSRLETTERYIDVAEESFDLVASL